MFSKRGYSAKTKVAIISFIILLVQVLTFDFIFSEIDVLSMLEKSMYNYYANQLDHRAMDLSDKMGNVWTSDNTLAGIKGELEYSYESSIRDGKRLKIDYFIASALLNTFDLSRADGVFILLNEDMTQDSEDDILFFKDKNNEFKLRNAEDIRLAIGSARFAENLGIKRDELWEPRLEKDSIASENLKKIKSIVISTFKESNIKDSNNLAFWLQTTDIYNENVENLTYIYPIIDKYSAKLYGIIGIEISPSMLADILRIDTISARSNIGFAILESGELMDKNLSKARSLYYFGDYIEGLASGEDISYKKLNNKYSADIEKNGEKLLGFKNKDHIHQVYGISKQVKLYDKDSYYTDDTWDLVLFLDADNFSYNKESYRSGVKKAIFISMAFAIMLSILLSRVLTSPIRKLSKEIEDIDTSKRVHFKKTKILEVDRLTDEIEKFSHKLLNSSFSMQNLLEVVGHGIVILEERDGGKTINRIGRISVLLDKEDESEEHIREYDRNEFKKVLRNSLRGLRIKDVSAGQIGGSQRVFKVLNVDKPMYIRYELEKKDGKIFHIYTDYTNVYDEIYRLEWEKNHDQLTGLANRQYFEEKVKERLAKNPNNKYVMIMWDLDNLKYVNDKYGHNWGDVYLKEIASVISRLKNRGANTARFSGDEFFAFLEYEDKEEVRNGIASVQAKLLDKKFQIGIGEEMKIRASVGMCWYPDDADSYDKLYRFADFAMYSAKHNSKGSIREFDRETYEEEHILISGREAFNELLENSLVRFAFQPIVSVKTGEVFGYEALMRPTSEKISNVALVMKMAKAQFQLDLVEGLSFRGVLERIEDEKDYLRGKKVFINSIANVVFPAEEEKYILDKLGEWSEQIVIEITESEELNNKTLGTKTLYRQEFGNLIAIDDFGAGYSTESSLLKVIPDFIKLDMQIIRDIHLDESKRQLVKNIIDYSKSSDMEVIAEGVESIGELEELIDLGVDYIQGYYLAKPDFAMKDIPASKKSEILKAKKG